MTTNTSEALIVTGRGIRSLKRQRTKALRTTHPHVADVVSSEAGYNPDDAEKPVTL